MNAPKNPILIGIIAGLASAILLGVAAYASLFAIVLSIAAMAAIFVAGLGFGLVACLAAVATAALASGLLYSNPMSALGMALILLPAVVMSYLANMARPANELGGPEAAMAWYPLSDVMLAGAVMTALGTIATLLLHSDMNAVYVAVADMVGQMLSEVDPNAPVTTETKTQIVSFLQVLFPLIQSLQMMISLFAGFYVAMRILTATGRSARPREDIRSSLRMNRLSIAVFLAGIALMFAGDKIEVIGAGFAGAVAGGYLLSGFAILHNTLRDKSWRLPGLILAYLLTMMVPIIPIVLIIAGGLANPRRAIALTPNKPDQNPANQN
jgi:hypothetical protein